MSGCRMRFDEFRQQVADGDLLISADGTVPDACPHLRAFAHYTPQFIPYPNGSDLIPRGELGEHIPPDSLTPDKMVRGRSVNLLNGIDSYCVDPGVRELGSCFREREAEAAREAVEILQSQGLPGVLPAFENEREHAQDFIWLDPVLNGQSCTPQNCLHREDVPPGFVLVARKGSSCQM